MPILAPVAPGLFLGFSGPDCIIGTDGPDVIEGGGGDDVICGFGGDDTIDGEDGDDLILGGDGVDQLVGGAGHDEIRGGDGDDTLHGDEFPFDPELTFIGNDRLYGEAGDDTLHGARGDDFLHGGAGTDTLNGGSGVDFCVQSESDDGECEELTPVSLSSLAVHLVNGQPRVRFSTTAEAGASHFEVIRLGKNNSARTVAVVPVLHESPLGGTYRVLDRVPAKIGEHVTYELIARGPGLYVSLGTFNGALQKGDESALLEQRLREPRPGPRPDLSKLTATSVTYKRRASRLKLGVVTTGMVRVTAAELATHFGTTKSAVHTWLTSGLLRLTVGGDDGEVVRWWYDAQSPALVFYGEAPSSRQASARVYGLRVATGQRMETHKTSLPKQARVSARATFTATTVVEKDVFAGTAVEPEDDLWFWSALMSSTPGYESFTTPVAAPALGEGTASVRVHVQGAAHGTHSLSVFVNGASVGTVQRSGMGAHVIESAVDRSLLVASDNTIEVRLNERVHPEPSVVYVNRVELFYPRQHVVTDGQLAFTGAGATSVRMRRTGGAIFEVSSAKAPALVMGTQTEALRDGPRLVFMAKAKARYVAVERAGYAAPAWIKQDAPSNWRATTNGAEYVVLAPAAHLEQAGRLAALREEQGLTTAVIDVEDIYDEHGDGSASPQAIRAFLQHAVTTWSVPPQYVVLAGTGSLDARDVLGHGDNLIPTFLVPTGNGLYASDARLADVVGDDGLADVAIGRVPARTAAELGQYVDKVARYEAAAPADAPLSLIADAKDGSADFAASAVQVASQAPFVTTQVSRDALSLSDARAAVRSSFTSAAVVGFMGHGSLVQLGKTSLFGPTDLASLPASDVPPVLLGMTCTLGRFELPGFSGIAEDLALRSSGGAIAVLAASSLSEHGDATAFLGALLRTLTPTQRLGDALLAAQSEHHAGGGSAVSLLTYNLLGDPALRHRLPSAR